MENNIQLFKHPEFGKVRVVMIEGEPWFVGKDVAKALGYKKPENAVKQHVPDKYKLSHQIGDSGQKRNVTLINEAGMYKLVMRSKLESAEKFSDWVCGDVLISIRKTGSYSLNKNDRDPLAVERDNGIELLAKAISELTAVERNRLAFEQKKFNVENSENAIIFKTVNQLIELAILAGDEKYIRSKLVSLATNLLVRDKFIDESDIIFKK